MYKLVAAMAVLAISALRSRAEVTVTETLNRVAVENESVRLVFDPTVNYVPVGKPGMDLADVWVVSDSAK